MSATSKGGATATLRSGDECRLTCCIFAGPTLMGTPRERGRTKMPGSPEARGAKYLARVGLPEFEIGRDWVPQAPCVTPRSRTLASHTAAARATPGPAGPIFRSTLRSTLRWSLSVRPEFVDIVNQRCSSGASQTAHARAMAPATALQRWGRRKCAARSASHQQQRSPSGQIVRDHLFGYAAHAVEAHKNLHKAGPADVPRNIPSSLCSLALCHHWPPSSPASQALNV